MDLLSQLYCWNLEQHVLLHHQSLAPKHSREKDSQTQQHKIWRKVEVHPAKTSVELVCLFGKTFLLAHTDSHQVHRVISHMSPCHYVSQVEGLAEVASGTQGHFTYESCVPDATFWCDFRKTHFATKLLYEITGARQWSAHTPKQPSTHYLAWSRFLRPCATHSGLLCVDLVTHWMLQCKMMGARQRGAPVLTHRWHDDCVWHDLYMTWLTYDMTHMWHDSHVIWLIRDIITMWNDPEAANHHLKHILAAVRHSKRI